MFDVFGDVKALFKLESTATDNVVFRLHYKATLIILIVCSILVTSKTYIGDPIDCIVEEIPPEVSVLNLYSDFQNSPLLRRQLSSAKKTIWQSSILMKTILVEKTILPLSYRKLEKVKGLIVSIIKLVFLKSDLKSLIGGAADCFHNRRDAERVP